MGVAQRGPGVPDAVGVLARGRVADGEEEAGGETVACADAVLFSGRRGFEVGRSDAERNDVGLGGGFGKARGEDVARGARGDEDGGGAADGAGQAGAVVEAVGPGAEARVGVDVQVVEGEDEGAGEARRRDVGGGVEEVDAGAAHLARQEGQLVEDASGAVAAPDGHGQPLAGRGREDRADAGRQ